MRYPFDEYPDKASDWRFVQETAQEMLDALRDCVDELDCLSRVWGYAQPNKDVIAKANKILSQLSSPRQK